MSLLRSVKLFLIFCLFFSLSLGLCFSVFGTIGLAREMYLRSEGRVIQATITNQRINDHGNYEVQYQFAIRGVIYSASDEIGGHNLWEVIPTEATGSLDVLYLPSDPWINRPVMPKENPLAGFITGFVLGAILLIFIGERITTNYRRYWAARQSNDSGAIKRLNEPLVTVRKNKREENQ